MNVKIPFRSVVVLGLLVLLLIPANVPHASAAGDPLPTETLQVQSASATHSFNVEVASTNQQRARGLMFRETMAEDHGMLFVFEADGQRFFWMKNTPLPLDILFISAAGVIVSIAADTTPFSEDTIPSLKPARFVLELNAGMARKLGISPGDMVRSPSMDDN